MILKNKKKEKRKRKNTIAVKMYWKRKLKKKKRKKSLSEHIYIEYIFKRLIKRYIVNTDSIFKDMKTKTWTEIYRVFFSFFIFYFYFWKCILALFIITKYYCWVVENRIWTIIVERMEWIRHGQKRSETRMLLIWL